MAIDREAALKKAEKFLRQGKLDGAIEEYVRLVEDQPRDWNAINALGDLYARAGDSERAVEQFTRVADYLFSEGFFPKAAALYKKVLKVNSVHEPALRRLGEIAARQGLLADAKTYFRQLADQQRFKGDQRGAAESLIRLATLEDADAESQINGARAAQHIGNARQAAALLKAAAEQLGKQQRQTEALDLLAEAAQLDPTDQELRARMARESVKAGQLERAQLFLTRESAGDDPDLLLALAHIELKAGRDDEAKALLTRLMTVASERHEQVLQIALQMARDGQVDRAFGCVELLVDAALLDGQWTRAAEALRAFAGETPYVAALMKLVEICVDAGDDSALREAQAQLADAYLKDGRGAEARVVAEDLVHHDPSSQAHIARLRSALELLGVADIDRAIAERLHPEEPLSLLPDDLDLPQTAGGVEAPAPRPTPEIVNVSDATDEAFILEPIEVDLSSELANIGATPPPPSPARPAAPPAEAPPTAPPRDLESVFEDIRARVEREQLSSDAGAQYERALVHLAEGRTEEAVSGLQAAARVPLFRFKAAAQLARLHAAEGDLPAAIEWFERAAEAPAPSPDEGFAVLYELASGLEQLGERARALAVLLELDADAAGYRDVRNRIDYLTREQAGSRGA